MASRDGSSQEDATQVADRTQRIPRTKRTSGSSTGTSRRAARVQLGDSVLAAIRLEDGRRTKAKLQTISATGGLLRLPQSLGKGDFVEVAFQTQAGPVHGMAEILSPMRSLNDGVLQPFRFVALEDDDHRRLRTSLEHVTARTQLGIKSSAFSTY